MSSFLVSSSHEKLAEENRWFWGGAIVESVKLDCSFEGARLVCGGKTAYHTG